MQKSKPLSPKPTLIILLTLLALFICIFLAIKLLSISINVNDETETPNPQNGTLIIRAVDGDTLELADGEIIRLLCVDTPEEGKEGFEEATDYLSSFILAGNLRIEPQGLDKYNRTLAWIYVGETLVNKGIIDNGYGSIFPYEGTNCSRVE